MFVDKHFYPIIASEASLLAIQPAVCMYLDSDNLLVTGWPRATHKRSRPDRDLVGQAESPIFGRYSAT